MDNIIKSIDLIKYIDDLIAESINREKHFYEVMLVYPKDYLSRGFWSMHLGRQDALNDVKNKIKELSNNDEQSADKGEKQCLKSASE